MNAKWPVKPLGQLCSLVAGGTPSRSRSDFYGGRIPWVKIGDMLQGVVSQTEETITQSGLESSSAKLLPAGTVLVSIFATIGRTATLGVEAATNQAIVGVIPKELSSLSTAFLRYFLDHSVADLTKQARGVAQSNINGRILRSLNIPVPPLSEQERIARLLDAAEELRRLRAQADRGTADLIPALFYDMFGDPATNPKRFERLPLHLVCERITDGTHQPPPFAPVGLPFLFVANIVKGHIDFNTEKFITENTYMELTRRVRPERGDILYSTVGSYGVAVQVETDQRFAFQRHIGHIKPVRSRIDSAFLSAQLNTPFVRAQADKRARGVAQKTVNLAEIRQFHVLVPPLCTQRQFAARVAEIRALEACQAQSRRRLDDLFQSLLHRAFQGGL